MYDVHDADRRLHCNCEYTAAPEFEVLQSKAIALGFRKATLSEINASATSASFAVELYSWKGGLWAKA